MQSVYCYAHNSLGGVSQRTVGADYVAAQGERLVVGDPASPSQIETWFPGAAAAGEKMAIDGAVQAQRLARVRAAYLTDEKRVSLYGYMAQINALVAAGAASDDQKQDLATLLAAATWEQAMLDAAASLVAAGDPAVASRDASWPALAPADASALSSLAAAS